LVETAGRRGHEITIFNRGQHNAELFPDVEKLRGDRDGGLDALKRGRWDAVIDTSGMMAINIDKAIGAGLKFRPLSETVGDTLSWANGRPVDHEWRAGLSPEKEEETLADWHALAGPGPQSVINTGSI
jgi:hypothetical protein